MQTGTKLTVIFVYTQYLSPLLGYFYKSKIHSYKYFVPLGRFTALEERNIYSQNYTSLNSKAPAERHIKSLPFQLFDYTSKIINLDLPIFCTIRHSTDKTDSLNLFATILRLRDCFLSN